jgi:adenosylcobalamin-dependent ribonucleoside-triphosphate reductase
MQKILSSSFIEQYATKPAPFQNWGLGEFVYTRTYSRIKDDGTNEKWFETIERVVNGTFALKKRWFLDNNIYWNNERELKYAEKMYDLMFNVKFLPGGRGLWSMGTKITETKHLYAALNNCAFVSTDDIETTLSEAFTFLMDACMLGVGVGFDTKGAGKIMIHQPNMERTITHKIDDSREGWVHALELILESYFLKNKPNVEFDYSGIRPAGTTLGHFGGVSSGPEPLINSMDKIREILNKNVGSPITSRTIVDVMNLVGLCVVSGNVRRSASIALGDPTDTEFINLKNYEINPERAGYGWLSNNSVAATIGMDYTEIADSVHHNGEPGLMWLDNMRNYSRMNHVIDRKDSKAQGANPCSEQTLENRELCCLVETFINRHETLEEYIHTLKFAFMYAKTITLGMTHWDKTNEVLKRNRRIGCSITGITNFMTSRGINTLREWCLHGYDFLKMYDRKISNAFHIPESIKITSVKPSGTLSLLVPGTCSGIHFPENRYYIRRVRVSQHSDVWKSMKAKGYFVEPSVNEPNTLIINFPVDLGPIRSVKDVSMWEQLELASMMQECWADNQVSCTVTFDPTIEGKHIGSALNYFQYKLKGISFLPLFCCNLPQMPFESITAEKFAELDNDIKKRTISTEALQISENDHVPEVYCTGEYCVRNAVTPPVK